MKKYWKCTICRNTNVFDNRDLARAHEMIRHNGKETTEKVLRCMCKTVGCDNTLSKGRFDNHNYYCTRCATSRMKGFAAKRENIIEEVDADRIPIPSRDKDFDELVLRIGKEDEG